MQTSMRVIDIAELARRRDELRRRREDLVRRTEVAIAAGERATGLVKFVAALRCATLQREADVLITEIEDAQRAIDDANAALERKAQQLEVARGYSD